jgi:ribosomal protein L12E/L44/L45/RPP1/RPP2
MCYHLFLVFVGKLDDGEHDLRLPKQVVAMRGPARPGRQDRGTRAAPGGSEKEEKEAEEEEEDDKDPRPCHKG